LPTSVLVYLAPSKDCIVQTNFLLMNGDSVFKDTNSLKQFRPMKKMQSWMIYVSMPFNLLVRSPGIHSIKSLLSQRQALVT